MWLCINAGYSCFPLIYQSIMTQTWSNLVFNQGSISCRKGRQRYIYVQESRCERDTRWSLAHSPTRRFVLVGSLNIYNSAAAKFFTIAIQTTKHECSTCLCLFPLAGRKHHPQRSFVLMFSLQCTWIDCFCRL